MARGRNAQVGSPCSQRQRRRSYSPVAETRHFFKIIFPSTLHDKKLRIPYKFAAKFGDELSRVARVVDPNGRVWRIGLRRAQNNIWFHGGWQKFVEHHSIGHGYVLVFMYRGSSSFSVLIFDRTACEIQCQGPLNFREKSSSFHENEEGDDDPVETMGRKSTSLDYNGADASKSGGASKKHNLSTRKDRGMEKRKRGIGSRWESPNSECRNAKRSKKCVEEENAEVTDSGDAKESKDKGEYEELDECEEYLDVHAGGFASATQHSERAIHAARMFKPKCPSFMVLMRPHNDQRVFVPSEFARRYMREVSQYIRVHVSDGREWPVRITKWSDQKTLTLAKGWNGFFRENNLEEGDVCVFELIRDKKVSLKVTIFRAVEDDGPISQLFSKKHPIDGQFG